MSRPRPITGRDGRGKPPAGLQRWSLRARLTMWVIGIFTLIQLATGTVFWLYQRSAIDSFFYNRLIDRAQGFAQRLSPEFPISNQELAEASSRAVIADIFDAEGNHAVTGRQPVVNPATLPIRQVAESMKPYQVELDIELLNYYDPEARRARAVLVPIQSHSGKRFVVFTAFSDALARQQSILLARVLLLGGIIGPIAAGIAGWFIAGIAVAPFDRLRGMASRLGPESLGKRIEFDHMVNAEVARLAEELDLARQRIQTAFASQERFLSNVSHELKTPIATLLVEAQTIDLSEASEEIKVFIQSAQDEMMRLGRLVESFLTLTRVKDGKGLARFSAYAVNELVVDSVSHCSVMAQQHLVRLVPRLLADETTFDTSVSGEPELLRTMLDNIVRNAIRFTPEHARVTVSVALDDVDVLIYVDDEGPGIPEERLPTIFDRFTQAHDGPRFGRGHGLGLAIAQGIAELHGGSIAAENRAVANNGVAASEWGSDVSMVAGEGVAGCRFTIRLPIRQDG